MTADERTLLDKLSNMEFEEYEKELNNLLETYDFDNCSEDFDAGFRNLIAEKYLSDLPYDDTPYEEALEKWFNSLSKEDQEAFLNEDWSEFDDVE